MATLKHPKQSQHKIAAPSSELENKNNGGSDMKNTSENWNVATDIAARASSIRKITKNDDDGGNNMTTSFSIGTVAAATEQASSSATTGAAASNRKHISVSNQRDNNLMKIISCY